MPYHAVIACLHPAKTKTTVLEHSGDARQDTPPGLTPPAQRPADRLPLPDTVQWGRIHWSYALTIAVIHLLALAAFVPWLFSWTGVIVMIVGVHVFGQAINICYHRQLTHRSFKTPRWLEHLFVLMALACLQDTPARWVATHRFHHQCSDEQPDPHSPLVNFLWSHVGWLVTHNDQMHSMAHYQKYARDVLADPFYMKLEKQPGIILVVYLLHALLYFLVGLGVVWLMEGALMAGVQFGLSLLVWGVIVRTVAVWHITWSVNSLTHLFGYRNYQTDENSRNNWLVALVTVGEGWHNNHHHDQTCASNQRRWWELDISYYEIKLLQWLGLARDVVPPREQRVAAVQRGRQGRSQTSDSMNDTG